MSANLPPLKLIQREYFLQFITASRQVTQIRCDIQYFVTRLQLHTHKHTHTHTHIHIHIHTCVCSTWKPATSDFLVSCYWHTYTHVQSHVLNEAYTFASYYLYLAHTIHTTSNTVQILIWLNSSYGKSYFTICMYVCKTPWPLHALTQPTHTVYTTHHPESHAIGIQWCQGSHFTDINLRILTAANSKFVHTNIYTHIRIFFFDPLLVLLSGCEPGDD